jgi:alanyl-tRNA synthetase
LDEVKKLASARNHTATHLLQAALKSVVGEHVNQAGSSVNAEHLRFDFSSFEPVSKEQLQEVEAIVNAEILKGTAVDICQMSQSEAKEKGAMALFGEKYGDVVRVVSVADFSMELCGGSHVENVGQIGLFKIMSESGVASGVRRIEAVTGKVSMEYADKQIQTLQGISDKLKTRPDEAAARVDALLSTIKDLEQQLTAFNETRAKEATQKLLLSAENYGEVQVVIAKATASDMDELRNIADMVCDQLTCGTVVLAAVNDGKVSLVVKVSKAAVTKGVHAGKIIKDAAKLVGGGGGGRPDMAQAGGKVPEKLADAFIVAAAIIKEQIH